MLHTMETEQHESIVAWMQAIRDENRRLNDQIAYLTQVIEQMGMMQASIRKDAETTRFRVGAMCLCFIILPVLVPVLLMIVGFAAAI
jgi:hypothetical protein